MVEIRTANNGARFMFDWCAGCMLVYIDGRLHMTVADVPNNDIDFQEEVDKFMDSWDWANGG